MNAWEFIATAALLSVLAAFVHTTRTNAVLARSARRALRRRTTWLIALPASVFMLTVGAPFAYTHLVIGPPPKPLTFADLAPPTAGTSAATTPEPTTTTTIAPAANIQTRTISTRPVQARTVATAATTATPYPLVGRWAIGQGTQAGYSIDDTVMGQSSRVVGRTTDVSGTMEIAQSAVTSTRVVVNMQTVTCHCVHDSKYHQMLETDRYPTSSFELTNPIPLNSLPPPGAVVTVAITGNFTIHGVTRSQTFTLKGTRIGPRLAINGSVPVNLSDYNIQSPDAGPMGGLSNCTIDLLIAFDRLG